MSMTQRIAQHVARGFDATHRSGKYLYPKCSQCQALVINGHACHEAGCPNATHECKGCDVQIPVRQRYCEECAQ